MPVEETNKDTVQAPAPGVGVPDGPTDPVHPPAPPLPSENKDKDKKDDDKPSKEDDAKHRKRFLFFLVGAAILFAILLIVGIIPRLRSRPKLRDESKKQSAPPPVQVAYPTLAPAVTTLELPGSTEALQQSDISARASGYIKQWLVDIGDNVKAGQVVAILDTPDVAQEVAQARSQVAQARAALVEQRAQVAQAVASLAGAHGNARKQQQQVEQAKADLNLALVTYQRWAALAKEGAVATQAADEKQAAYRNNQSNVAALQAAADAANADILAYEANVRSAQANIGSAQAQVDAALANLRRTEVSEAFNRVRAPFDGVITARSIDQGVLIGGGADSGGSGFSVASTSGGGMAIPSTSGGGAQGSQSSMYNSVASSTTGGASTSGQPTGSSAATSTGGVPQGGGAAGGSASSGSSSAGGMSGSAGGSSGSLGVPGSSVTANGAAATNAAPKGGVGNGISAPPQASSATNSTTGAPTTRAPYAGSGPSSGVGGTVVSPGTSLFTIARVDILRIQVNVPQAYAPNIRAGQKAQILIREFPNAKFIGTVTRTARSIDPTSRTMLTEVQIRNPKKVLLPGMFGQIVFHVAQSGQSLLIPSSALISDSRGTLVGTVGGDNKIHLMPVQVGRDYGRQIAITSGLDPQALVILSPSDTTVDGADAKPAFSSGDSSSGGGSPSGGGDKGKAGGGQGSGSGNNGGGSAPSPTPNTGQRYGGTDLAAPLTPTMQPQPQMSGGEKKKGRGGKPQ